MELSSRAIAFSPQEELSSGVTAFPTGVELGSGFSLSGKHRTARSGWNSVPGVSASSSQGGTQFRGHLLPPLRAELSSGGSLSPPRRNSVPRYLLFPTGVELSSRAIASSSQGGTEFRLPTSDDCTIKRSCYKLQLLTNKNIVKRKIGCLNIVQGNQIEAACPLRRVHPPDERKEG